VGEALRGQRQHHLIHAAQAPLPLAHQTRFERPRPVPGHVDLHWPDLGRHRLRPVPVAVVLPSAFGPLTPLMAQMIGELALQGRLQHPAGQLGQQTTLTGQLRATGLGPGHQLPNQLLTHGIQRASRGLHGLGVTRHVSHQLSLPARELHHSPYSPCLAHHPEAAECTVHVAPCGVALFHIVQPRCPDSLTELALWRYRSYASDLPWAAQAVQDLVGERGAPAARPEYVLSLYWVNASPWSGDQLHTALRLLSTPSVLVDRGAAGGVTALDGPVEETLLASGFDHPDVVPFGVRGVSAGYAGWSGLAYTSLSAERSLGVAELVACELAVQTLWCYSRQIQQMIEDGQDPAVPEQYGWRFLRAAYSRLTTARPQETAQHCLMREAIVKTSGLAERLRDAQDALRECGIG
jgi:hypothetical protein